MPETLTVNLDAERRLLVAEWRNSAGCKRVCITPEYQDRKGGWHLAHSSLTLTPDAARELAPAILQVAAGIDAAPQDPRPTEVDRDESRMP